MEKSLTADERKDQGNHVDSNQILLSEWWN